jgi:hypothetical protein
MVADNLAFGEHVAVLVLRSTSPIFLGFRRTAGAAGFFILSQWGERPDRQGEPSSLLTMPSNQVRSWMRSPSRRPIRQRLPHSRTN